MKFIIVNNRNLIAFTAKGQVIYSLNFSIGSLQTKVDKEPGKELSTNDYTTLEKDKLASLNNQDISTKVDKVTGKGLSTEDYSTAEKSKLSAIEGINTGDQDLSVKVDKILGKGLSTEDYTSLEKTKLAGIAALATANDTDANLKARANHTGTQPAATISDFQASVSANADVAAMKTIIGQGVTDGDSVVNTLSEMLATFQTYNEGTDIATQLAGKEIKTEKDNTNGYAGLTLFKINFKNALNTFTSFLSNANTAVRQYIFPDRNGTIADDTDITAAKARANHTGSQSADTITDGTTNKAYTATEKTKLAGIATGAAATLAANIFTGKQTLSGVSTTDSKLFVGGLEVQPYNYDNIILGINGYYNAGYKVRALGYVGFLQFGIGGMTYSTVSGMQAAGASITPVVAFTVDNTGKLTATAIVPRTYTPTSTADASGVVGEITRDDNYSYQKTASGWKRSAIFTTF